VAFTKKSSFPPHRKWYGLQAWRRRSADQLRREPLCQLCKQAGRITEAKIADHDPPHKGDWQQFMHGPLRSLCWPCHSSHTLSERSARRTGKPALMKGCDLHGVPLDPRHHWHNRP
jgi:5-methylcytosine-specific restriction enzyme A